MGYTTMDGEDTTTAVNSHSMAKPVPITQPVEPQTSAAAVETSAPAASPAPSLQTSGQSIVPSAASTVQSSIVVASSTSLPSSSALALSSSIAPMVSSPLLSSIAVAEPSLAPSSLASSAAQPTSSTSSSGSSSGGGMSGGAKAGLAFGIIFALGAVAALVFFCYRRKKRSEDHEQISEKASPFGDSAAVVAAPVGRKSAEAAPQLSLRPVTEFLPNGLAGKRSNAGNGLTISTNEPEKPKRQLTPPPSGGSVWERRAIREEEDHQANPFSDPENPFDNDASEKSVPLSTPAAPAPLNLRTVGPENANAAAAIASATAAAASTSIPRKQVATVTEPPPSLGVFDMGLPSPAISMNSVSSDALADCGGGAKRSPPQLPTNVHRVQLDFKPSMEDELELKAGELVKMLHEYDDGWVSIICALILPISTLLTDYNRLSASAWTVPSKV